MRRRLLGAVGIAAAVMMTMASMARAAEDYEKFGVRVRAIYVMPDESFDNKLSAVNAKVSDDIMPELDLEYFFLKSVSTELIAGVTRNDIKINGQFQGSTWLLPPTLTVKYHPLAGDLVSPYIGFGLNVTFPFNSRLNGDKSFSIDNSVGWAAQIGADIKIKDNLYFNIDYKYINADTKVTIAGVKYDLDLNPHLFGIGVGYRF
jgi:outer membrane protein